MAIWRHKKRENCWMYETRVYGTRIAGSGQSKSEAGLRLLERTNKVLRDKDPHISIDEIHKKFSKELDILWQCYKVHYRELYRDPRVTLADFFDRIMEDVGLPYRFHDLQTFVKNCEKNRTKVPATVRYDVLSRDHHTCQSCGRSAPDVQLHVDHIVPVSRGGLTEERNLITLCKSCNFGKGVRAGVIWPRTKPHKLAK